MWIATQYVDGTDAAQLMRERFPVGMPGAGSLGHRLGDRQCLGLCP